MRTCLRCKDEKRLEEFYKCKRGKDRLSAWCITCQKQHKKEHYQNNKERYTEHVNNRRRWFVDLKTSLKCNRCGFSHPAALDFHHLDPSKKEFEISSNKVSNKNKDKILEEIKKCEILCSNCHRIEHWKYK